MSGLHGETIIALLSKWQDEYSAIRWFTYFCHKPVVILIFYLNIFLSGGWGVGGVGWGLFHEKKPHNISGYTLMDQHILLKIHVIEEKLMKRYSSWSQGKNFVWSTVYVIWLHPDVPILPISDTRLCPLQWYVIIWQNFKVTHQLCYGFSDFTPESRRVMIEGCQDVLYTFLCSMHNVIQRRIFIRGIDKL